MPGKIMLKKYSNKLKKLIIQQITNKKKTLNKN